jgi:hypothetical protein
MIASERSISDYVEVTSRFRRSVNLEKDYLVREESGDYIVTPTALETLHRLAEGIAENSPARAWTVTGPFGVGKSAFAEFTANVLCSPDDAGAATREQLRQVDPELAVQLADRGICTNGSRGFLPVLVTARRAPAAQSIAEGIIRALRTEKNAKLKSVARKLESELAEVSDGRAVDTRWVVNSLETAGRAAREAGHDGVLLIIDELGKFFEYAARYPQQGDVYVLQELAEYVARSQDVPALLVGLLHQSFEEYGQHLDQGTRREWSKIQGRFGDIAFLEPADQVVRMVARAIQRKESAWPKGWKTNLDHVVKAAAQAGVAPPGMSVAEFTRAASAAYPLHPLTLVALPYIFRRFAQNERSLFSYLSSLEPFGFQDFIKRRPMSGKDLEFVRLHDLFDYFTSNFGLGLYRQPQAMRWLEAADVLESKGNLGTVHQHVVKTVGVLSALGQFSHLSASAEMIAMAVQDQGSPDQVLQAVLNDLRKSSVLTYRGYNRSYRIWEGSDVDLDERIAEGERQTQRTLGLADSVRGLLPNRPMVARRHSFETGALRSFETLYVDAIDAVDTAIAMSTAMDGKAIVCLPESTAVAEQFRKRALQDRQASNVLFAIPQQIGELRGLVSELGALRWAWDNTPELRDDRIARRELSLRITEAEQLLQRRVHGLLDPRPEPIGSGCTWIHAGQTQDVTSPAAVSQLLSHVFDRLYDQSPRIRNELIVRRNVSAAASAARRNLVEFMLTRSEQPTLGIQGFPPERSMYESVLGATGIHRQRKDGSWGFSSPSRAGEHSLLPCWNHFTEFVFKRQPEPLPVVELFAELSAPPFGVMDGLHPVLLCAFMMVFRDETTLYREGTFLPEPGAADFEVLMRRPELFAFAGSRVKGGRADVVSRLGEGLQVPPTTVPVVRALFRIVKSLPEYAWNTRQLPSEVLALRDAFHNAKSPERFLFVQVPAALGRPEFSERRPKPQEIDAFFDALNRCLQQWSAAMPRTLDEARDVLLEACGFPAGESGWEPLRLEAVRLERSVTEPQLLTFLRRVAQSGAGRPGVESVCALVASRPPANWTDADATRFPDAARAIGRAFRESSTATSDKGLLSEGMKRLDGRERKRAEQLLQNLRAHLRKSVKQESARVIKAVLAELAREMDQNES